MSVTVAQVARLLSASNEQLYDRYINFRLSQYEPKEGKGTLWGRGPLAFTPDFVVRTPATGIKPSITVSGTLNAQNTVNLITLTVVNMNANIDTMAYNWCEVEVGYLNSGIHTRFCGEVTNCYMAKPNPNGELVVSIVNANITELYEHGSFSITFLKNSVTTPELIKTCLDNIKYHHPELKDSLQFTNVFASIPPAWLKQTFTVSKATYNFRSPMACIIWLNSLFASYTVSTGFAAGGGKLPLSKDVLGETVKLPPMRLGFTHTGMLVCRGSYSDVFPGSTRGLSSLGSAFISGEAATITAPFNPDIVPGEVIFVDPRYFKTRVNIEQTRSLYKSLGNLWKVISMQFTFSTITTNTMTLQLNNVKNIVRAEEG